MADNDQDDMPSTSTIPKQQAPPPPISRTPKFLCVDYPGVVKNVEKAIDTLGGLNKLAHDYYKTAALELDYHRDNIYSRPTTSRVRNGTFLIVKARRRKPRNDQQPPIENIDDVAADASDSTANRSENQESSTSVTSASRNDEVDGEILGVVSSMHRFTSMFDFQYLPIKRVASSSNQQPKYVDILPNLFPTDLKTVVDWLPEEGTSDSASRPEPDLFLPPFAFSRFNNSNYQVLGREPQQIKPTKGAIAAAAGGPIVGLSLRKERRMPCFMVQGDDPFPSAPHPMNVANADERIRLKRPNELMEEVFNERPMWSKNAIMVKTQLDEGTLKVLMPKYAFYILSGPFGRVWCRFGYDPRTDPNAVQYQTIMINLSKMGFRTTDQLKIGYKVPAANRLKVTSRGISTGRELRLSKVGKNWYIFEPGVLPPFRQVWYQIMDIQLPTAEEEIRKALAIEEPFFRDGQTENTNAGWLLPGASDRVRDSMKESLKSTLDEMDKGFDGQGGGAGVEEELSSDSEIDDTEIEYFSVEEAAQATNVSMTA